MELSKITARNIIQTVGNSGQPPEEGFDSLTVGLDPYLRVIKDEYLSTFIKDGGSSFKMIVGTYGGGKTHFLYALRKLAWNDNYAVSYISLSPNDTPFHKIDEVVKSIIRNVAYPQSTSPIEKGIASMIKSWQGSVLENPEIIGTNPENVTNEIFRDYLKGMDTIEESSFRNAVKHAFLALQSDNDEDFDIIRQWLEGENPPRDRLKKFNIYEKYQRTTAFKILRSFVQWIKFIGYSGLIILFDEAEHTASLSSRDKEKLLTNLRELIDSTTRTDFKNVMIFYAVPDIRFLEGRSQFYEALNQRLSTIFDDTLNPSGIRIDLEKIADNPIEMLIQIGKKLRSIYELAFEPLPIINSDESIEDIANASYEERFSDIGYKRLFVKKMVAALNILRAKKTSVSSRDVENIK